MDRKRLFHITGSSISLWLCLMLTACGEDASEDNSSNNVDVVVADANPDVLLEAGLADSVRELIVGYLKQVAVDFDEVENTLIRLQEDTESFLEAADDTSMDQLRDSWLAAHSAYELTALHRYFATIILDQQSSLSLFQLQYQINHWPILPGYIDYVGSYTDSGIVNDMTVALDAAGLLQQHGVFDLAEVSLGFHVLEFLLWGENLDKSSPRPATDYDPIMQLTTAQLDSGLELDQLSNNRRRQLLLVSTATLVNDFRTMQDLWQIGSVEFAGRLEQLDGADMLVVLMETMTSMLTEELLVRSLYPMLNGEFTGSFQSPFSHSTQNAVSAQLSGLERLLLESRTESGRTLDSLLITISPGFEEFFYQNFDASKECLVLLYSSFETPQSSSETQQAEFEIVECINLLTNMIDNLEQIKIEVSNPV